VRWQGRRKRLVLGKEDKVGLKLVVMAAVSGKRAVTSGGVARSVRIVVVVVVVVGSLNVRTRKGRT
jgi:hypothetical protein